MVREKTKCLHCKEDFECGAGDTEPCWCTKLSHVVPLSSASCLCPNCLIKEISKIKLEKLKESK